MDTPETARTIKSDETLLTIIETLADQGETSIVEIAEETGLSKSTVYFHLATLEQHGLVAKTDSRYRLGLRFFDLGILTRDRQPLFAEAKPKTRELAEETGEKSWCFVEERGKIVYLYGSEGEHPAKTRSRPGQQKPLHTLAAGKAILAHLPDERREKILDHHGLTELTENTITDRAALREELEEVRERGVAFNNEESIAGLRAVAAPVKKADGGVYGAISIAGPAHRLTGDRLNEEMAQLVLGAANELEINLRYD